MRIAIRLIALLPFVLLCACQTLGVTLAQFDRSSREYNHMVRWQEYGMANVTFVDKEMRAAYEKKAEEAKGVRVVDFRVLSSECEPEKGTATVNVEFDYYILPSAAVKTVRDTQKWVYREEPERGWHLMTVLPDFPK
jgi:hypothetical protein